MTNNKDMKLFNKLSEEQQLKIIEAYIADLPEDEQEIARQAILGE